jgi:ATP-dependent Clp protease ATP-binding subunit ClpA
MRRSVLRTRHRISRLADEAAEASEPEAALRAVRDLQDELAELERARVAEALRAGCSFGAIARALGISRQAAHRRFRDLAPHDGGPMPLSSHARRVVQLTIEEAGASGSRHVASEHLLLAVLRSGGGASQALESEGVTADAARRCLVQNEPVEDGREGVALEILNAAAEIARSRSAACVEAEHIALAALNHPDGGARRAVVALGVTLATVRTRLGC